MQDRSLLDMGLSLQAASIGKSTGGSMGRIKRGSGSFTMTLKGACGHYHDDCEVEYKGYSDPGNTYGPPENCWPPEGEVEILSIIFDGQPFIAAESEGERIEQLAFEHLQEGN